jgi:hypothetical protein
MTQSSIRSLVTHLVNNVKRYYWDISLRTAAILDWSHHLSWAGALIKLGFANTEHVFKIGQ